MADLANGGAGARGPVADFFVRLVREKPLGLVGAIIILLLLVCAIFADVLTPYEMDEMIVMDRLAPPSAKHLLGADGAGRDILTRLIHGARISLVVGLSATTVTIVVAAMIGVPSGYLGGRYDLVVQRFVDGWMAFPGLLVLLTVMSIVGRGTLQPRVREEVWRTWLAPRGTGRRFVVLGSEARYAPRRGRRSVATQRLPWTTGSVAADRW